MRKALTLLVSLLALALGIWTALLQSANRSEGIALDRLVQECSMVEAVNQKRMVDVLALDLGPERSAEAEPAPMTRAAREGVE